MDSRIAKWLRWLDERIKPEVLAMHLQRDTFRRVGEIAEAGNLPPSYFWHYVRDRYATTQALAVREAAARRFG